MNGFNPYYYESSSNDSDVVITSGENAYPQKVKAMDTKNSPIK